MTLVHLPRVDSTQATIFDLAAQGAPDRTVVVADYQAAGRGRRGRAWDAPPGTSLLASILVRPRCVPERWGGYSLVSALAAADTLTRIAGLAPRVRPYTYVNPVTSASLPPPAAPLTGAAPGSPATLAVAQNTPGVAAKAPRRQGRWDGACLACGAAQAVPAPPPGC